MGKHDKTCAKILQGDADANIPLDDVRQMLLHLEFDERISGSHHIFRKQRLEELINLQEDGNKAKPYQIRQVRVLLLKYKLGGRKNE